MTETGEKKPKACEPLMLAVRQSFGAPHFVTLSEVRDSTGFDSKRSADALALGMFRSRGRLLYGFEFKVSRSDWLCELRKPEKAESWFQYCDRWGLIVPDASIVKIEELPAGWGLGVARARGVKWIVQPPVLSPAPLDRHALCALVFRAMQNIEQDQEQIKTEAMAEGYARSESERQAAQQAMIEWREIVTSFENSTGLSIRLSFREPEMAKRIGDAIRLLQADPAKVGRLERTLEQQARLLEGEAAEARRRSASLREALAAIAAGQCETTIPLPPKTEYEELMGDGY